MFDDTIPAMEVSKIARRLPVFRLMVELYHLLNQVLVITLFAALLSGSSLPPGDQTERVRAFTRDIEYDYVGWTLDALRLKLNQFALGTENYLSAETHRQIVADWIALVWQIQQAQAKLSLVYADPNISDKESASADLRAELADLRARRQEQAPLTEAIIEGQVSEAAAELGLTLAGQPAPPVLYHSTPLPLALIISPRDTIRQDEDISLLPDLPLEDQIALEEQVDAKLGLSSLVVPIGGVGLYPTMVQETRNLDWLAEVVAHEWAHNFLTLRPLGINYMTSPELRIINETAASIAGKEIGRVMLERYYPELVPPSQPAAQPEQSKPAPDSEVKPPVFDFNTEMRTTRVETDRLLAAGEIDAAEAYMEQRRVVFWENGYRLRKINQAYFAFYGAYADHPSGGAAGADPVGAAVRTLRERSGSLAEFLNRISWVSSWEGLQRLVQ